MLYVTYNDAPSGVYSSQVNDVCNYLNESLQARITLVAFISMRGYLVNRKKIRSEVPAAMVLPILPRANYWGFSCVVFAIVCLFKKEQSVIARNVLAAKIALFARKLGIVHKVGFDGRGAIAAEWKEYKVVHYDNLRNGISTWERDAVLQTDFRIAVSEKLVDWWRREYGYNGSDYTVIPCTLQRSFRLQLPSPEELAATRKHEGYTSADIILVYSGSVSGWQSFGLLRTFLENLLRSNPAYKLIFLAQPDPHIDELISAFPNQVVRKWLAHKQVQETLCMGDYGILYRELTVTNEVAAPTKFAEYLSAGLPVLISDHVGDYTAFTRAHHCGHVIEPGTTFVPPPTNYAKRKEMIGLAATWFTKEASRNNFMALLNAMSPAAAATTAPSEQTSS